MKRRRPIRWACTLSLSSLLPSCLNVPARFLRLQAKHPEAKLVPSPLIRAAWLSHLIRPTMCVKFFFWLASSNTFRYIADCTALFGAGRIVEYSLAADSSRPLANDVQVRCLHALTNTCAHLRAPLSHICICVGRCRNIELTTTAHGGTIQRNICTPHLLARCCCSSRRYAEC